MQFFKCRDVLKTKMKQLKGMGKGNLPNAADALTDNEIDQCYEAKLLGPYNAVSLRNSMWRICTTNFGMRTGIETHELKWGDISCREDISGEEYLVYTQERQTKTRPGNNPRDIRKIKPKAYATPQDPEKCPVALYKVYQQKRPSQMLDPDSPFLIGINHTSRSDAAWYKNKGMGLNSVYQILKDIQNFLQATGRRIVPYRYVLY